MSALHDYLNDPTNSTKREHLLTSRFVHDMGIAAASNGYELLSYFPSIDSDGVDVILDDKQTMVPIQLKARMASGKTSDWSVHRSVLRPRMEEVDLFGFESSPAGEGRRGGVVLMKVTAGSDGASVRIEYEYTDVYVLCAFWLDVLSKPKPSMNLIRKLHSELQAHSLGSVFIPSSAFIKAPTLDDLLMHAGLHTNKEPNWKYDMRRLLEIVHLDEKHSGYTEEQLRTRIRSALLPLT